VVIVMGDLLAIGVTRIIVVANCLVDLNPVPDSRYRI
jgi:hypothetical protein